MEKIIKLETHEEAQTLFGSHDEHIKSIEKEFKVKIILRGEHLKINGTTNNIRKASGLIEYVLTAIRSGQAKIGRADLFCLIENFSKGKASSSIGVQETDIIRS
jgi:phosphate starvation-inducible protein PhoH and related proteins